MKKVGISTVYTGHNYGSALQAFSVKKILEDLGYNSEILHLGGSIIRGRDVRIKKALSIALRLLLSPRKSAKSIQAYANGIKQSVPQEVQQHFEEFIQEYLKPVITTWHGLKMLGKRNEYAAFVCGSDQIWNADTLYVDPQYYLRYAPPHKRIAFAPSFGRKRISEYNKKLISKYVKDIPYLSVREQSGITILKEIASRDAICLLDPTLFFSRLEWINHFQLNIREKNAPYLLAYFLDEPSAQAKLYIQRIAFENQLKIILLPHRQEKSNWFDESAVAGPVEFVDMVANASFVCTDSFHGTAFSLIMQVPFYTFERQYGVAGTQSTRIESLLNLVNLSDRYSPAQDVLELAVDFSNCEKILTAEKQRTTKYLLSALTDIDTRFGRV